jgi:hypothetical protein
MTGLLLVGGKMKAIVAGLGKGVMGRGAGGMIKADVGRTVALSTGKTVGAILLILIVKSYKQRKRSVKAF